MMARYQQRPGLFRSVLGNITDKLKPCSALRERMALGYSLRDLRADLLAGLVVAMVAMPLGMALAIASGVPPQYGLYTAIVGGSVVAFLGGSRFQVTGPTAAFVVILAPVAARFGLAGLLVAGLMAGVMLVGMGIARMGRLIEFIPYPVTTGFTAGIALVIATIQLKDFLGLHVEGTPESYIERVHGLATVLHTIEWQELAIGLFTLTVLAFWPPKLNSRLPASLVALTLGGLLGLLFEGPLGWDVTTIGDRFSSVVDGETIRGIPRNPPSFVLPWRQEGPGGGVFTLDFNTIRQLLPSAIAIALLAAIESLLSAVVADAMARTRHDPDAELVALGTGNILCPFFGGIAATGAIARTATGIRSGATSPLAAVFHAAFVLVGVMFLAPVFAYLPMAALAGLLMRVAWNISEVKHFGRIVRVAPRSDVAVLLACFGLTVIFDMVIGVSVGVVLAALLFMRRMAELTSAKLIEGEAHPELAEPLPAGVLLYEIAGPLFFGAAQRAVDQILNRQAITDPVRAMLFEMSSIPTMDITGLVALENAIKDLVRRGKRVILVGVQSQPLELIRRISLVGESGRVALCRNITDALQLVAAERP